MNEETIKKCNTCAPKGMTYSLQNGRPQVMLSEDFMKEEFGGQSMMEQANALTEMMAKGDFGPEYTQGGKAHQNAGIIDATPIMEARPASPFPGQPAMMEPQVPPFTETETPPPSPPRQRNYTSADVFGAEILGSGPPAGGGIPSVTLAQTDAADVLPGGKLGNRPHLLSDEHPNPRDQIIPPPRGANPPLPFFQPCDEWSDLYTVHTEALVGFDRFEERIDVVLGDDMDAIGEARAQELGLAFEAWLAAMSTEARQQWIRDAIASNFRQHTPPGRSYARQRFEAYVERVACRKFRSENLLGGAFACNEEPCASQECRLECRMVGYDTRGLIVESRVESKRVTTIEFEGGKFVQRTLFVILLPVWIEVRAAVVASCKCTTAL